MYPSLHSTAKNATYRGRLPQRIPSASHAQQTPPVDTLPTQETREEALTRFRQWRDIMLTWDLYDTAAYWGRKAYAMSGDPSDAYGLAHVYYANKEFHRALHILIGKDALPRRPAFRYLAIKCYYALGDDATVIRLHELPPDENHSKAEYEELRSFPQNVDDKAVKGGALHIRALAALQQENEELATTHWRAALHEDIRLAHPLASLLGRHIMTPRDEDIFVRKLPYAQYPSLRTLLLSLYLSLLCVEGVQDAVEEGLAKLSPAGSCAIFGLANDIDVLCARARLLALDGEYIKCRHLLEALLKRDPYHHTVRMLWLEILLELEDATTLLSFSQTRIRNIPDSPVGWYAAGLYCLLQERGTCEAGHRAAQKARDLDTQFLPAILLQGLLLEKEGTLERAREHFATLQARSPRSHIPYKHAGRMLSRMGLPARAVDSFEVAGHTYPSDPQWMAEYGIALYGANRLGDALAKHNDALKALSRLPNTTRRSRYLLVRTLVNLAKTHGKLGDLDEALRVAKEAIDKDALNPYALYVQGVILSLIGDKAGAMNSFTTLRGVLPVDAHSRRMVLGKAAFPDLDAMGDGEGLYTL